MHLRGHGLDGDLAGEDGERHDARPVFRHGPPKLPGGEGHSALCPDSGRVGSGWWQHAGSRQRAGGGAQRAGSNSFILLTAARRATNSCEERCTRCAAPEVAWTRRCATCCCTAAPAACSLCAAACADSAAASRTAAPERRSTVIIRSARTAPPGGARSRAAVAPDDVGGCASQRAGTLGGATGALQAASLAVSCRNEARWKVQGSRRVSACSKRDPCSKREAARQSQFSCSWHSATPFGRELCGRRRCLWRFFPQRRPSAARHRRPAGATRPCALAPRRVRGRSASSRR